MPQLTSNDYHPPTTIHQLPFTDYHLTTTT